VNGPRGLSGDDHIYTVVRQQDRSCPDTALVLGKPRTMRQYVEITRVVAIAGCGTGGPVTKRSLACRCSARMSFFASRLASRRSNVPHKLVVAC